jgi:hypothetical protein
MGKLESHPTIHSFPTISESTFGQFICALRRIASCTNSRARFLLVLVLLSGVQYLPLPIFTSLNQIPGGLSCTEACGSDTVISHSRSCFGTLCQARSDSFSCSRQTHFSLLYAIPTSGIRIRTDEGPALRLWCRTYP